MIGFAKWEDRPALAELWQVCFEEERRYANFFFNNAFRPGNCLVYRVAGRPAAMALASALMFRLTRKAKGVPRMASPPPILRHAPKG